MRWLPPQRWNLAALESKVWTEPQRMVLSVLLASLILTTAVRLLRDNQSVPKLLPDEGPRAREVVTRLDLNSADAAQLSAIPRLGIVKALAIVAYRQQFVSTHPGQHGFERMEDLYHIKGVGPSTMEQLRQYTFIGKASTSNP